MATQAFPIPSSLGCFNTRLKQLMLWFHYNLYDNVTLKIICHTIYRLVDEELSLNLVIAPAPPFSHLIIPLIPIIHTSLGPGIPNLVWQIIKK